MPNVPLDISARSVQDLANIKYALDMAAIVAITDVRGKILHVNDTFCEISKYSREELIGQDHRIINSGHQTPLFFKELWATIKEGKVWQGEINNRAKDGSYYWVDTTIVPLLGDNGQPEQFIAIRKDITYAKRIERELRLLNEGLEERVVDRTAALQATNRELAETLERLRDSERMRETFVSALTHDLRTPLVAEGRALDLLAAESSCLPLKLQALPLRLIKNNEELLTLVNKLLEIYHYESGQVLLHEVETPITDLVYDCFNQLQPIAQQYNVHLVCRSNIKDFQLCADPGLMKRLLTNLLGNAIQSVLPDSQPEKRVSVSLALQTGMLIIRVQDTGIGISADKLPHLFERYFAVAQTNKKIGSGLGLSISLMIARLHGGTIEVESTLGTGSVFTVIIPQRKCI